MPCSCDGNNGHKRQVVAAYHWVYHRYNMSVDCDQLLVLHFTYEHVTTFNIPYLPKLKAKAFDSYTARLTRTKPDQPRFTIIRSGSWSARTNGAAALMRLSTECTNEQLDPQQQLANTPLPQSTTPDLHHVSIHQMMPPKRTSDCSLLPTFQPRKDEGLSWQTCSRWLTHITGHSSDAVRAQTLHGAIIFVLKVKGQGQIPVYPLLFYSHIN